MKVFKGMLVLVLALAMSVGIFSTAFAAQGDVTYETLRVAIQGEPQRIGTYDGGTYGGFIAENLYNGLIFFNSSTNSYEPCLATKWETIDDCTIRYYLRDDVYTQNGTQLKASDVVYTFRLGLENNMSHADFSYYDPDNFNIVDDFTIDIKTYEPFANAFVYLAQASFFIHVEADLEPAGGLAILDTEAPDAYGAYLLQEWAPGDHITLERNENYWGDKSYFKELEISFIQDDTSRYFAVQAGDVDLITYATASQAAEVAGNPDLQVFQQQAGTMTSMAFNCGEGCAFAGNEALRKAICYAINKDAIVQVYTGGYGSPVDILLPVGNGLYQSIDEDLKYTYDPEKAKEYLKEAGYEDGFTFRCILPVTYQKVAEVVQSNLADIGVTMELDSRELAGWLEASNAGDYDANMVSFFPGNNIQPFYMMDGRVPYNNKGVTQYPSDEWNDLLDQLYATPDIESGQVLSKQLTEIFAEHLPAACLVSKDYLFIADAKLDGFYTNTKCDMLVLHKLFVK